MAGEVKRVAFTTVAREGASSAAFGSSFASAAASSSSSGLNPQKSTASGKSAAAGKGKKSFRIEVELFEPDAESFPEYNFRQLVLAEKKKDKKKEKRPNGFPGTDHGDDPLGAADDDDDVARLAREMEEKYGSGSAYSKSSGCSKRATVEQFDKGLGYDDNDSFIDNTDAYDELMPDEIEPNHGGFYINSGLLEFHNRPNYERPEDAERMPKARKRTLSTSSEEEDEDEAEEVPATTAGNGEAMVVDDGDLHNIKKAKKKKKKSKESSNSSSAGLNGGGGGSGKESSEGEAAKKQKLDRNEAKPLKIKISNKVGESEQIIPTLPMDTNQPPPPPPQQQTTSTPSGAVKTTTVKDMLRLKRDNHRNSTGKQDNLSTTASSSAEASDDDDDEDDDDSESEPERKVNNNNTRVGDGKQNSNVIAALPEQVSKEMMQSLIILEESARLLSGPGENVLSNPAALDVLLAIEQQTIAMITVGGHSESENKTFRQQVYAYLSGRLKCAAADLMAKGERMRIQAEETKTRKLLVKLKKVVESRMAKLLETYEAESRRVTEMKNAMHVIGFVAGEGAQNPHQMQMPRRRFHWTDSSRKLLYDVYVAARANYAQAKRSQKEAAGGGGGGNKTRTAAEFLAEFLKQEVLPLWPTGWMKYEELVKEVEKRRVAVQRQNVVKELVNSSAWEATTITAVDGGGSAATGKDQLMGQMVNGTTSVMRGEVIVTAVPKAAEKKDSSSEVKVGVDQSKQQVKHSQSNLTVLPPPIQKKHSYDYSITNLIGGAAPGVTGVGVQGSGTGSLMKNPQNATNLKIKSVATLNKSTADQQQGTVIVSCDDDDDEGEVERQIVVERVREVGVVKKDKGKDQRMMATMVPAGGGGGGAAPVRSKRTSDSDSSCEIVNVYNNSNNRPSGQLSNKLPQPQQMKMKNGSEDSLGKISNTASRSGEGGQGTTAAVQDVNDIDVNQIMQDLKDWQQWESGFNANKKTEFAESRKDVLMKKAKFMDHLSSLTAANSNATGSGLSPHPNHNHHHHNNNNNSGLK